MHAKQLLISSIAIILIKCYRVLPLVWTVRKVCSPRMHGAAVTKRTDSVTERKIVCQEAQTGLRPNKAAFVCKGQLTLSSLLQDTGDCWDAPINLGQNAHTSPLRLWRSQIHITHISHAQLCLYHGCSHATSMSNITHCSSPSLNKHVDFVGKTSFHLHLCALSQSERDQSSKLWSLLNYCTMLTCPWIRAKHPIWNIKH